MSWIKEIDYDQSTGSLRKIYDRVKGPDNNIDNVLSVHSLRPHTLVGHMTLYKNVLHNTNNTLPKWYLETLGIYVSYLNQCSYCVDHHFAGLSRLINDDDKALKLRKALENDEFEGVLESKYISGCHYAKSLTTSLVNFSKKDFDNLKNADLTDGEILEINQVVSYFNYVNRAVIGLGVNTEGDIIGLSPGESAEAENWSHA